MIGITGITGHIGYALAKTLNRLEIEYRVLVRNLNDPILSILKADIFEGDILDQQSLNDFCKDLEVVIHLAGFVSISKKDAMLFEKINVEAVQKVINACITCNVTKLIHFSSIHAHKSNGPFSEINELKEYAFEAISLYDRSKARGEKLILDAREDGLNTIILNPTGVIGPYDNKPSLVGKMIIKLYQRKLPVLVSGGFDWVDVRDVVDAVVKILHLDIRNEKFIIAGSFQSLMTIAELVYSFKDKKYRGVAIPISLAKAGLPFAQLYSKISGEPVLFSKASLTALEDASQFVNGQKAVKVLEIQKTPFEKTIFDTLRWFKDHQFIK